ncbi:LysR family transcriptional regulator [Novimethylophilus kurashikiensis]|uniref:LysR family transcriptional regulator n=1 Tax=Novimethylophilus kurashikiensis TaxID=1825523 RepID=UPI000D595A9B|nr:LysR family transcriptional regulator [Novimethylophilus kurashikiensis]
MKKIFVINLADLKLFIRVSETGNISASARGLGQTPASASAAIKRLERQVGSQLFARSTRSLRLTQAGEDFLQYCVQSTQLLEEGIANLKRGREALSGEIHLGAPSDLGRDRLDEELEPFRREHPQIRVVMHLSDTIQDLYRNQIDLVLRYGVMRDSSLIALKLCDNRRVVCCSPEYIARMGRPETFEALQQHNCICFYRSGKIFNDWRLTLDGRERIVQVHGDRAADDGALVRQWALQGTGIAFKSHLDVERDLAAGRLVDLFPTAQTEPLPLYIVYPNRKYQPSRLQALIRYLQQQFPPAL